MACPIPYPSRRLAMPDDVFERRSSQSLWLGFFALVLGPLTGIPGLVQGLGTFGKVQSKPGMIRLSVGIFLSLFGTFFVSGLWYLTGTELCWPDDGRRVDRIFGDICRERSYERQNDFWPGFRQTSPDALYRAVEKHWPTRNAYTAIARNGWMWIGPSGLPIHRQDLHDSVGPIIVLGKPAVPHLFKWVTHDDWHVRYAAIHAIEEITQQVTQATYLENADPENTRDEAIHRWQKWLDEHP